MKIKEIRQSGNIFYVTKTPNWLERLLGYTEKVETYAHLVDRYYVFYPGKPVIIYSNGKVLGATHKMTKRLEEYRLRREVFTNQNQ